MREKLVVTVSATGRTRCGEFARLVLSILGEQFFGGMLKHGDEFVADNFSFLLRIGHASERGQETLGGVDIFQTHMKIFAEHALDNFFFARAQETIVHENAGELIPDRLVEQRGRD